DGCKQLSGLGARARGSEPGRAELPPRIENPHLLPRLLTLLLAAHAGGQGPRLDGGLDDVADGVWHFSGLAAGEGQEDEEQDGDAVRLVSAHEARAMQGAGQESC